MNASIIIVNVLLARCKTDHPFHKRILTTSINTAFYWARELVFTVNTTCRPVPNRSVNSRSPNDQSWTGGELCTSTSYEIKMAASTCRVLQSAQRLFFITSKGIFVSFSNANYVETRFVKIKEYTHKKKKQSTWEPRLLSFPPLFTRTQHNAEFCL